MPRFPRNNFSWFPPTLGRFSLNEASGGQGLYPAVPICPCILILVLLGGSRRNCTLRRALVKKSIPNLNQQFGVGRTFQPQNRTAAIR